VQQLRTAGGPFLDIWDEEGDWWVSLADVSQARQFCVSSDQPDDDDGHGQVHDGPVCTKCDIPLDRSQALVFSEKELHLEMAISSLRHLNNPIFQMQSGELPDWIEKLLNTEEAPQIQDEGLSVGPNEAADGSETEANTAIEPSNVAEDSDKDCDNRPSTNAQLNTVEAEGSADSPGNTDNKADGPDSTANDGSMSATENMDFPDCSASDESADDEDRQIFDSVAEAQELAGDNQDMIDYWRRRTNERFRYEVNCWYYHLRRAEEMYLRDEISSSPAWEELKRELDSFVQNDDFFKRWQWMLFLREIETEFFTDLPWKPLHLASFLGLTSWAQHLIAGGHSLTERSGGVTPLLAAGLKADNLDILELLLEHGADPNDTDDRVGTPCLHRWLRHDQSYKAMKLFIDHGADPTKENPTRGIAMHYLAAYAHDDPEASDVLELLITSKHRSKEEIINAPDEWQMTPLHHLLGRREVPKELLKDFILQGADVNLDDDTSLRPLQNACYWGDIDVVQILLPTVTHVDDPDNHGRTALHEAAWAGHRALVEILINDKGADPNVKDFHGRTPLFFACLSDPSGRVGDSRGTIKFLIETLHQKGLSFADINSATKRNRTPLRQAAARGFKDVVEDLLHMLRNSGADAAAVLNGADTLKGRTALHCAAARGHQECVRLLLEFGADVRVQDKSEKTALQLCYEQWALTNRQEFEDTALLLCDKDPAAAVGDAELPAVAATNNSRKLLQRLAAINVDLARPDQYGWTPLALARRSRSFEAKGYLEEYFARDAQLPSRWLDPGDVASLSESGLNITYIDKDVKAVLTSDKPLPAHLTEFYFEIRSVPAPEIKNDPKDFPILAIGFCTLGAAGLEFPGWPPLKRDFSTRSWAWHGDDGGHFDGISPRGMDHGSRYRAGDTVGCGIDLEEGRMWFTLNGKRQEKEFLGVGGRLFPVVGLHGSVMLETRFAKPFFMDDGAEGADGGAKEAETTETTNENAHDKSLENESAHEPAEQTNVGEEQASGGAGQETVAVGS
jgi:ankyrin repeat protein